ncbi:Bifunctional dihydrofolate reductase-thymidylate synthase [Balamuthia mandrillaris]
MAGKGKPFSLVVAATKNWGIGLEGKLPWSLPKEMAHFKALTLTTNDAAKKNAVIMGRKTFESIPPKFRPLPNRFNIVLSRTLEKKSFPEGVFIVPSFNSALELLDCDLSEQVESAFVIGGANVFEEAMQHKRCRSIYLTRIHSPEYQADTFLTPIDENVFKLDTSYEKYGIPQEENGAHYEFLRYVNVHSEEKNTDEPHEERQYLDLVRDIIENGNTREDRTGVGTKSKFGCQMRFSLRNDHFPLLTTKRVFWRGVAEELLWFISGSTNANTLSEKNVNIWKPNGSKEFLAKRGLGHREEGDLGPVYGFQWRHWGAEYTDMHADYKGKGLDQLAACIDLIKRDPTSRRIVMSAWNPSDLDLMALPPCHMFCQFYVANDELSCQLYQRSADMGLGIPFNIASYALLTRLVAQVCGLKSGELVHTIGDAHVYLNHIDGLKEQLQRDPLPFPKLHIKQRGQTIDDFTFDDLELEGYQCHKTISLPFAV